MRVLTRVDMMHSHAAIQVVRAMSSLDYTMNAFPMRQDRTTRAHVCTEVITSRLNKA